MKRINTLILALLLAACTRGDVAEDTRPATAPAQPAPAEPASAQPADSAPTAAETAPVVEAPVRPAQTSPAPDESVPAPADSAAAILERAAAKYAALRSLQADFSMTYENPLLRTRVDGRGVLYQRRPDRLLLRFSEPAGDIILSDGEYYWVYYPSVERDQVVRTLASAGDASGVDLQAQFLGDPTRRFQYTLDGEEQVNGRAAWLLTLVPRERTGYRKLRVWVDQADHLVRRFEITEDNSSIRRFELRNLRPGVTIPDATFRFDVPAGVRVITR